MIPPPAFPFLFICRCRCQTFLSRTSRYEQVDAVVVTFPRPGNGPADDDSITARLSGLCWLATQGESLPPNVERIVVLDATDLKDLPITNSNPNLPDGIDIEKFWRGIDRTGTRVLLRRGRNAQASAAASAAKETALAAAEAAIAALEAVESGDAADAAEAALESEKAAAASTQLIQTELAKAQVSETNRIIPWGCCEAGDRVHRPTCKGATMFVCRSFLLVAHVRRCSFCLILSCWTQNVGTEAFSGGPRRQSGDAERW